MRGIVFDLRANGGGLVEEARLIASLFIAHGTIVSTRGRTQPSETITATGDPIAPTIPMVVLVDHNTASSSEIVTAALQDHHRATVVGTHTFGKGVFQEEEPLSNGGALDITVGEYFTPDGRNLGGGGVKQGAGITPEVPLANNVVDTPQGLDAALKRSPRKSSSELAPRIEGEEVGGQAEPSLRGGSSGKSAPQVPRDGGRGARETRQVLGGGAGLSPAALRRGGRHPRASRRITLGSNRVADRGGEAARAGDLVLVGQAAAGEMDGRRSRACWGAPTSLAT